MERNEKCPICLKSIRSSLREHVIEKHPGWIDTDFIKRHLRVSEKNSEKIEEKEKTSEEVEEVEETSEEVEEVEETSEEVEEVEETSEEVDTNNKKRGRPKKNE